MDTRIRSNAPLYWLAPGAFAVGTESFMIAGLLPGMAADLAVSVTAAGQLVAVFALAYALSSPILIDRRGPRAVIVPALLTSTLSFLLLSASAHLLPRGLEIWPAAVAVIAWGVAHWAFYPAQQTALVGVAGVKSAPIVLSLNASFMYLGFSLGAALGSLTLTYSGVADLGYVSAAGMAAALALTLANGRRPSIQKLNPA